MKTEVIKTGNQYKSYLERIDELWDTAAPESEDEREFELLCVLVENIKMSIFLFLNQTRLKPSNLEWIRKV